jgi:hypothetical protein
MIKGIQYSHYVGGDLMEIQNAIDLAFDKNLSNYMDGEEATSEYWESEVKNRVTLLRNKIAELDRLNEMNY